MLDDARLGPLLPAEESQASPSLNASLPPELRGDYAGLLMVLVDGEIPQPRFCLLMGSEAGRVDIDTVRGSLLTAAMHKGNSDAFTIIKDTVGTLGVVSFEEVLRHAHRAIEDWSRAPISMALNDYELWEGVEGSVDVKVFGSSLVKDYFSKCPTFKRASNPEHPWIIFKVVDSEVVVQVVKRTKDLLDWPRGTKVMGMWPSADRAFSFYQFRIENLLNFMASRGIPREAIGTQDFVC
jgi:hypothetical protein